MIWFFPIALTIFADVANFDLGCFLSSQQIFFLAYSDSVAISPKACVASQNTVRSFVHRGLDFAFPVKLASPFVPEPDSVSWLEHRCFLAGPVSPVVVTLGGVIFGQLGFVGLVHVLHVVGTVQCGKFGPAYSPWSNGINERNHASADLTIKKLMEEKRTSLTDALVKAAAWAHNTSINKLGFSPLQLVTGKAVTLPGLTTGNVATESMTESEAVQRTVESLSRVVSEFREADMRKKLKECQNFRIPSYQHLRNYVEGDKVWYQPLNGTAWYGPAAVLCQRGSTV